MGPSIEVVLTICASGFALMNEMTAMPKFGKNTFNSSPEQRKP